MRNFTTEKREFKGEILGLPCSQMALILVDEDGEALSDDEVATAYRDLSAIGYPVVSTEACPLHLPSFGTVTAITPASVDVDGVPVPRTCFHDWYELDLYEPS